MQQHQVQPNSGRSRKHKRVGRGDGSGRGTYSGRGVKGQKARSGRTLRIGFEGGQTPLIMRMPKLKGFKPKEKRYVAISLLALSKAYPESGELTPNQLMSDKLIPIGSELKIIGNMAIDGFIAKLDIKAHRFSVGAKEAILKGGGKINELKTNVSRKPSVSTNTNSDAAKIAEEDIKTDTAGEVDDRVKKQNKNKRVINKSE